jgi:hypothetical protein
MLKAFASLLKEIRKQLGLSQKNLARELGVSFATVNRSYLPITFWKGRSKRRAGAV